MPIDKGTEEQSAVQKKSTILFLVKKKKPLTKGQQKKKNHFFLVKKCFLLALGCLLKRPQLKCTFIMDTSFGYNRV